MGALPVPRAAREIGDRLRATAAKRSRVVWPARSWKKRHAEFARDVLGIRSLASHQIQILDEYYRSERAEVVACTGQKMGKTEVEIIAELFDFATEPGLNGFIFGPKLEWIDEAQWPRFVLAALGAYYPCASCVHAHRAWCALVEENPFDETPRPERCLNCSPLIPSVWKDPDCPEKGRVSDWLDPHSAAGGLRAPDGRVIRGYASRKIGGKGGLSGNVRFYLDESSDIDDETREAIAGNMAGGGKLLAFGNMLRRRGWFYRAFKGEEKRYTRAYKRSSRLSPNCHGRITWSDGITTENSTSDRPVRGMADREGIEANLRAWKGTELIAARIDAEPPAILEGQLIPSATVVEAARDWTPDDNSTGILQFGVDVGRARDPLAIAERRGRKVLSIYAEVLGEEDHSRGVEILMGMVRARRRPHERSPRIVFDETGHEGARFGRELRRYVSASSNPLDQVEIIGIQFGHPPRNRKLFDKRRDELAHGFAVWLKTGSVPPDGELEAEIEATIGERVEVSYGSSGMKWEVLRVVDNDTLRKTLGRSPNKRNACELAVLDVDGDEAPPEDIPLAGPQAVVAPPPRRAPAARRANDDELSELAFNPQDAADNALRALWGRL